MKKYWQDDWLIGLVVTLLCFLAMITDLNRNIELTGYDLGLEFSSEKPVNQDVVIIKIDEASLKAKGAWPWPRNILAEATRKITAARPAVIGYVMPLDRKHSIHGLKYIKSLQKLVAKESGRKFARLKRLLRRAEVGMDTDHIFSSSLRNAKRVVLAIPFLDSNNTVKPVRGLNKYAQRYKLTNVKGIRRDSSSWKNWFESKPLLSTEKAYLPIKKLVSQAKSAGTLYLGANESQIRTEPLVIKYGNNYLPSFVLMMAASSHGYSTRSIKVDLKKHKVSIGKENIEVDNKLRVYPKFYRGNKKQKAFSEYSMLDVLKGKVGKKALQNKTVLIGVTAPQYVLAQQTPIGERMVPVRVIAHKVSSLVNNDLIEIPSWALFAQFFILLLIGAYLIFLLPQFPMAMGMAISGLLLIVILNIHFISIAAKSVWLPMMTPLLALVIGHIILATKKFIHSHLSVIRVELSRANQLLGQSFHSQGKLDQAMEEYRKCIMSPSLLEQMYNLGLDYERKRQFNKAVPVFESIEDHSAGFRDVKARLKRNSEVSNSIVLGTGVQKASGTMMVSHEGMEKPMLGRYTIDKEIGRGAMGMVYLGHDPKIGRTVAIKTLIFSQEFEDDKLDDVKERFFREAETAGRLNHPNIVTIYDVGEDQEMSYIAMDYLKGFDLFAYAKQDTLLPVTEVLDIIIKVANALHYANEQKVVHRDIKPANIIYDKVTGVLKVTDFGVACVTDTSKTKTGTILGSPSYMSPEQLAGKRVDGRSDLFSLGVTMFQLLTGELPFVGESLASLMYKIANEKHPDIRMFNSELPSCVSRIINKSLQKNAEERFESGHKMAEALRRCKLRIEGN